MTLSSKCQLKATSIEKTCLESLIAETLEGACLDDTLEHLDSFDDPLSQEIFDDVCEARANIKVLVEISYQN